MVFVVLFFFVSNLILSLVYADVCMVFELLGDNLLSLIRKFKYKGLPLPVVRYVTRRVLVGLQYMHDDCHIIHTDLKPENVLLRRPNEKVLAAIRGGIACVIFSPSYIVSLFTSVRVCLWCLC